MALVASLLFVLSIEFLNTAIERLCNHIQPDRHEAIRITKDLASAGVFFALALGRAGLDRRAVGALCGLIVSARARRWRRARSSLMPAPMRAEVVRICG